MSYVLAKLVCDHEQDVLMADVRIVSTFCHQCHTKRAITDIVTTEWFAKCYDCRFRKYFGNDKDAAEQGSRRHWLKCNDHRPTVTRGKRPKSEEARAFLIKAGIVSSCG